MPLFKFKTNQDKSSLEKVLQDQKVVLVLKMFSRPSLVKNFCVNFMTQGNRAAFFNTVLKKVLKVTQNSPGQGVKKGVKRGDFELFTFF
jgi:hypothetical protein